MKKLFFSLMAVVAVCIGLASCNGEDVIIPKLIELFKPAHADKAGVYETEGCTLELTESGNYVVVDEGTRAAGNVYTGVFTVSSDGSVILTGSVQGSVDLEKGKADINVGGANVSLKKKDTKKDESEEAMKLCRTWNIEPKAVVDGDPVTISAPNYEKYFGNYGYPKQFIISAVGTFCVICDKQTYAGTWHLTKKGQLKVDNVPFADTAIPYNIGEDVTLEFAVAESNGKKHTIKAYLNEVINK